MDTKLNAKQRRRLLREQQRQQEEKGHGRSLEEGTKQSIAGSAEDAADKVAPATPSDDKHERRVAIEKRKRLDEAKPLQKKRQKATTTTMTTKKKEEEEEGAVQAHGRDEEKGAPKSIHLTLFVGQLPFRATEGMIRKHFAEAGDIKLRMLTDEKTKKFRGLAFIEVKDSKALGAALSRHHTLLQGRRINVELTASGGGNKSENRRSKIDELRKKQSSVQVEKTKALIQKHIDGPQYNLQQEDVDDRMIDFLSWFDYETAKNALEEYNRCVSDRVNNRKAFFMGILKRFRQTDGVE
ncbi:unnamed protein product [Hyaloperonospora brassicae]|uniref:RRM domain-containing protein n=1 Tax=Hyaloperonospora brassicae TaxID=162125 RepID=A0AAV0T2M8_HYABA|nr:unnamed protein product [Hyaloperonospora brassicae]